MREKISRSKFLISLSLCLSIFVLSLFCLAKPLKIISSCMANNAALQQEAPVPTVHFPKQHPASAKPILTWTKVKGAVAYELELATTLPEYSEASNPNPNAFYSTKKIYGNGFNADLPLDLANNFFYWRVRGLGMEGNPISDFSDGEKVYVDYKKEVILKPIPTSIFNQDIASVLLYPVYSWVPITGANKYEVEILDDLPNRLIGMRIAKNDLQPNNSEGGETCPS